MRRAPSFDPNLNVICLHITNLKMHCGAIESTLPNAGHLSQNMTIHKHEFQYTFVFWWWEWLLGERMTTLSTTTTDVYDEIKTVRENQEELRALALGTLDGSMPEAVKALPRGEQRLWWEKLRITAIAGNRVAKEKQRRQDSMSALANKTPEELVVMEKIRMVEIKAKKLDQKDISGEL